VSKSAFEARTMGYLQAHDPIVMKRHELLYVAVRQAHALGESGYRPPMASTFPVAGRDGIATLEGLLVNMKIGGFISEHDYLVGRSIAHVLCGGDVDPGSMVDDAWMLALERETFLGLLAHPKTQERIMGFVKTGKPVRN